MAQRSQAAEPGCPIPKPHRPAGGSKAYPIDFVHIDIAEVRTGQGKLHLLVAIDRASKFALVQLHDKATRQVAADFLRAVADPSTRSTTPAPSAASSTERPSPTTRGPVVGLSG